MDVFFFWALLLLAGGLCAAMLVTAVWVRSIVRPNWVRARQTYGTPASHGLNAQEVQLPGRVYGWWAPTPNAHYAVLLVHGRSRRAGWMYPYAKLLQDRASVMAIDLPGHGKSRYALVSYGVRESKTIRDAVRWLETHSDLPILILGVSMGGASAILAQARHPSDRVFAMITIGAYDAIETVFRHVAQRTGLSWSWARYIFQLAGRIAGFDLQNYRPIDHVSALQIPLLITQGAHDELVDPQAAKRMAAAGGSHVRYAYYDGPHDDPSDAQLHEIIDEFVDDLVSRGLHQSRS